jgi:hypothetical protein
MSKWYEYNIISKKALLILMERSKRPMVVTAGKIFDLSLQTFTTVKIIRIFHECINDEILFLDTKKIILPARRFKKLLTTNQTKLYLNASEHFWHVISANKFYYLYRCTIVNDHTSYIQRAFVKNKLLVLLGKFLLQHRNYNNSTALLLDSNIRNSVCTSAKLPCRRVEVGYEALITAGRIKSFSFRHIIKEIIKTSTAKNINYL